jgi:decaprenylphospho-beta-D-ribofuranose 2-oxidase
MQRKSKPFSNFSRAVKTTAKSVRPDDEKQLDQIMSAYRGSELLVRGNGLSYSDCCVKNKGTIIETTRLNHLLSFDAATGIAVCQGGVTFADLFLLDAKFIPPVLPGTLHATVAGGLANDVHGKNNHNSGTLGHHIEWIDLQVGEQTLRCSQTEHTALFNATIAGLGLTGVIKRVAIRLRHASRFVAKRTEKFTSFSDLLNYMEDEGLQADYQVAWLDLLNQPRALLSLATHVVSNNKNNQIPKHRHTVPTLPIRFINKTVMKQFNRFYYQQASENEKHLPLWQFNNPLDAINHWNRLYGKQGLVQFQAVFDAEDANTTLEALLAIIRSHQATPTLAVLKYFTKAGPGLLSFAKPGFTLAIDFIQDQQARLAISKMNQLIADAKGRIYLAKDLILNREQFMAMYTKHDEFSDILTAHNSPMSSDLSKRLLNK